MSDELKPQATIDSVEFERLLTQHMTTNDSDTYSALITHIDAWGARLAGDAAKDAAPKWHAPGMGEVHYHDHSFMIECMREIDHPDQDYIASEPLANWVCEALNRAGTSFSTKPEDACGS
jgi:hypothetical protein